MNKEKEIREIEKTLAWAGLLSDFYNKPAAKALIKAGYRKAEEVRREAGKEIWDNFHARRRIFEDWQWSIIKRIFKSVGIEVEE